MNKEAMKLALEALERMKRYGNTFGYRSHEQNPYEQVCEAITALKALAEQPAQQEPAYTYTSTQATRCARCGEHKHTPLRIDSMAGYVCLTCIDKQLCTFYGEFGYPEPASPRAQPAREWVGLTEDDMKTPDMGKYVFLNDDWIDGYKTGLEKANAKLKEKNNG